MTKLPNPCTPMILKALLSGELSERVIVKNANRVLLPDVTIKELSRKRDQA